MRANQASSIVTALELELMRCGVTICLNSSVLEIKAIKDVRPCDSISEYIIKGYTIENVADVSSAGLEKNKKISKDNKHNKNSNSKRNSNKSNNNVLNLEWCTYSENTIHAIKTGLYDTSKHHPSNSKGVKCIDTGEIFISMYEAVKHLGKANNSISTLSRAIKRNGKAFGFRWEFIN